MLRIRRVAQCVQFVSLRSSPPFLHITTGPAIIMNKLVAGIFISLSLGLPPAMAGPTFQVDIRPILKESCISCHGQKKQMGGFRADIREEFLKDTEDGPWVIPGDAGASRLVRLLSGEIKTKKSPEKHVLPPGEVAVIRAWIDSGAN